MLAGCAVVEPLLPPPLLKMSESEALLPVPTPPMMNDRAKMRGENEEDDADPALAVTDPDDHEIGCVGCVVRRGGASARPPQRGGRARMRSNPHRTARLPPSVTSVTRAGDPPSTSAATGSSQGQNGVWSSRTATRSASSPRRERSAIVEPERARAVERRQLQRRGGRERLRIAARSRARATAQRASRRTCPARAPTTGCRCPGPRGCRPRAASRSARRRSRAARSSAGSAPPPRRLAASAAISSSPTCTACATTVSGPEQPALGQLEDRMAAERRDEARQQPGRRRSARPARAATRRGA